MGMIGLVAAMKEESDALLRRVKKPERILVGSTRGYRFDIAGQTCILVTSGMGIRRAAEATRTLVAEFHPRLLVSFGIAGAVEPELEIADVVAAESFCRLDAGVLSQPIPLTSLPVAAREAAVRALAERGAHLFTGTAITTGGSQLSSQTTGTLNHPILEMETAGIAQIANEDKIPLLSLRAISDGPRAPIPFDLGEVVDADANMKYGKMLKILISKPKLLIQINRMMQNSRLAEDVAAAAVVAVIGSGYLE